ncbi:MAG TPA: lysine--tRNA ligase [Patescibacteria group bacterium]|nr:lysine--tRNA ligase [Patescibacteria group bacterium]
MAGTPEQSREARMQHLSALEAAGINPFPQETPLITAPNSEITKRFPELEGQTVGIVGRITGMRQHGKLVFYDVTDHNEGKMQVLVAKTGEEDSRFDLVKGNYDEGDFVHAEGVLGKTNNGEITVRTKADEFTMLAKALLPPPRGEISQEVARRQRYMELYGRREARERFRMRSEMVEAMRQTFLARGFTEVETPVLDNTYGGANARPFTTHHNALDQEMFMKISPELYLKRLVAGNMGPVFEFSRNFRNEGIDATHNPEFSMMEAYEPYGDYNEMMRMTESMFEKIALKLHGTTRVQFGDHVIDFKAPWKRLTIYGGLEETYHIDPQAISDNELRKLAKKHGVKEGRRGDMLLGLFEEAYDGKLTQPTFVLDYPRETSPLTKKHRTNPDLVERFETYIGGMEVMNCYTELNDPREQRARLEEEQRLRNAGDAEAMQMDDDFITSMEYGLPPMGGIGISIDRMAMVLTNTPQIRDMILFPQVRKTK